MKYDVCVLMSTYNGEKYLREQLDSILNQVDVQVRILIRDDGSTDNTRKILYEYQNHYSDRIILIEGSGNVGWRSSFIMLLYDAKRLDATFYAFADQDDIWLPNKLSRACQKLSKIHSGGALYYANQMVVDGDNQELFSINEYKDWIQKGTAKKRVFIHGQALSIGCVMVFNRILLDIATSNEMQLLLPMITGHDNWMGMVAVYFGEVVYDDYIAIRHRQHIYSVTNSGIRKRKHPFRKYDNYATLFCTFFQNNSLLSRKDKQFILLVANHKCLWKRFKLICDKQFRTDSVMTTCKLRLQILLGIF